MMNDIYLRALILVFLGAFAVANYTVHRLDGRYADATPRSRSFHLYKGVYAVSSFMATLIITVLVFLL